MSDVRLGRVVAHQIQRLVQGALASLFNILGLVFNVQGQVSNNKYVTSGYTFKIKIAEKHLDMQKRCCVAVLVWHQNFLARLSKRSWFGLR